MINNNYNNNNTIFPSNNNINKTTPNNNTNKIKTTPDNYFQNQENSNKFGCRKKERLATKKKIFV